MGHPPLAGNGAVKTEQDAAANWSYGYDANNRLSSSNLNSGSQTFSYVYDRWGNRWQQNAPLGGPSASFVFSTTTNQLAASEGYTYDAAGERTHDSSHSYTYDAEGRVLKVDGGSTATYTYDADGNRVESITSSGTKDSVYNLDGQAAVIENATTQTPIRANTWWGSNKLSFYTYGTSPTTYFVEQTPLGTVSGLTSMAGSIYSYSTSYPFGDGVTWYGSTDPDTLFYAGLDHDSETNTEHAWARQYSSTEAVWTIPDPYSGSYDPNNPQSFNRYAYVLNNPLIFTDTSGLELDGGGEGDGGGDSTDDEYQGQQVVCCTNGFFGALADFFSAIGDGISTAASAVAGFLAGGSDPSLGGGPGFDGGLGGPGGAGGAGRPIWVNPTGNPIRGCDSQGCGSFGVGRGDHIHQGTDYIATPGQNVRAVHSGRVVRFANAYRAPKPNHNLTIIVIESGNYRVKEMYVTPIISVGTLVNAGDIIGVAQNVGQWHPGMTNHVHTEIWNNSSGTWTPINPATLIP